MKILIYVYPGITMLDAIGPYEVLRNLEGVDIRFVAKKRGAITADSQLTSLSAPWSIKDIHAAEVLIVPGSTIAFLRETKDKKVLEWIRKIDQGSLHTMGVCTGAHILAAAGLLEGREATTHWKTMGMLTDAGAIPVQERYVESGKYLTAAGVSAGIDAALYLANLLQGKTAAQAAQLAIEYDPAPLFNAGKVVNCSEEVVKLAEQRLEADARKDLSLWQKMRHFKTLRKLKK